MWRRWLQNTCTGKVSSSVRLHTHTHTNKYYSYRMPGSVWLVHPAEDGLKLNIWIHQTATTMNELNYILKWDVIRRSEKIEKKTEKIKA